MDRTQELEDQVQRLSRTVDEMRDRMAQLEGRAQPVQNGEAKRSRRGFLRMGAAAAAGALGWVAVKAVPAAAATGGYMVLGSGNLAENATTLTDDSGGGIAGHQVFTVQAKNFVSGDTTGPLAGETFNGALRAMGDTDNTPADVEGFNAWANGSQSFAVWGLTDTGTGVVGQAFTGIGVHARGTGRIRQDPQAGAGLPAYTPNLMEQVRDADGVLWVHNASGVWRRVNTLRTDAADGSGSPYTPFRIVDTRGGAKPAAGSTHAHLIAGQGTGLQTIPADAVAVVGNLTATSFTSAGYLAIFPFGVSNPGTSSVNFSPGQTAIANSFVCGLGTGQLNVFVGAAASHYIIDITGYIQ